MLCDLDSWERLKNYSWRKNHGYAVTQENRRQISFHREVMNVENPKIQVDHINGNRLDNRKENLRLCTNQENSFNKYKNSNNTSGFKGVYFDRRDSKWRSSIQFNGKSYKSPKRYDTPEEAYEWYKKKSDELFKEFSVYKSRDEDGNNDVEEEI